MESMTSRALLKTTKETRVDLATRTPNSIIRTQLPSTGTFSRSSRPQRQVIDTLPACQDEESFTRRYFASEGSIYFRKCQKYPRSILWRCLEENKAVELQCVDLSKEEHEHREAALILRLEIPGLIRRHGVALADPVDQDILHVFLLTRSNELHTITIRPDAFCRAEASGDDLGKGYKSFRPASFSISNPCRLFALSSFELVIALDDGRLVRLTRSQGSDGSSWEELAYNDGHWGSSLRGLLRWQGNNTVRYEGELLDQNTAVAASQSPDGRHILVVSINHTLKAWNIETGKVGFSRDLLNKHREPRDIPSVMLDPGIFTVMQILDTPGSRNGEEYYLVTFSPQRSGTFKFWGIRDADRSENGVRDLFPDDTFTLPNPADGALWTMAGFHFMTGLKGTDLQLWILMKLNQRYDVYCKHFDLSESPDVWIYDLPNAWQKDTWEMTATSPPKQLQPAKASGLDSAGPAEQWLSYIVTPGRFPEAILETSLHTYSQGQDISIPAALELSLKERLSSTIGSNIKFGGDCAAFREAVESEWVRFWHIAIELNKNRWGPLSLSCDEHTGLPWLVLADACSTIRAFTGAESVTWNRTESLRQLSITSSDVAADATANHIDEEISTLLEAAEMFRVSFTDRLLESCEVMIKKELWQDSSYSVPVRTQTFYEFCDFSGEIGDRQFTELENVIDRIGGFKRLDTYLFQTLINQLPRAFSAHLSGLVYTTFGTRVLIHGAQEVIDLNLRILTNLLLLVVFANVEVDEELRRPEFDFAEVYMMLLVELKRYQLISWLATTNQAVPNLRGRDTTEAVTRTKPKHSRQTTVLESLFAVDVKPRAYTEHNQSLTLSGNIEDLLVWVTGGGEPSMTLDQVLVHVQCHLLKTGNIPLAISFLQFQPSTAWATYIRGRLCLLRVEIDQAAIYFKKAAYNLSRPGQIDYSSASASLLTPLDASFFSTGLLNYYSHILSLFETAHAYSYVATFASLALQFLPSHSHPQSSSSAELATPQAKDAHTDLLSRLFYSALQISDFETAYSALTRYTDSALQHSALTSLISTMISRGAVQQFLSLPFPTLRSAVEDILIEKASGQLESLANGVVVSSRNETEMPIPWYKVLYAWRIKHGDFRGAAAGLMERLDSRTKLQANKGHPGPRRAEGKGDDLLDDYLILINALAIVGEEDGWVFVGGGGGGGGHGGHEAKDPKVASGRRRVVTLQDLRRDYQQELDRRSIIENGRFALVGGEAEGAGEGDVEEDEDEDEMDMR